MFKQSRNLIYDYSNDKYSIKYIQFITNMPMTKIKKKKN